MSLTVFGKQDFLKPGDNMRKIKHIRTNLVSGKPSEKPMVSITIPTYQRTDLLRQAVESCLRQILDGNFNIVITDDDPQPNNETELLINNLSDERILYFKNEENLGALANFNRCIEVSTGTYAVMLHTDDLLDEHYIGRVMELVRRYPDADIIIPDIDILINDTFFRPRGYQQFLRFINRFVNLKKLAIRLCLEDFVLYNPQSSPSGIVYKRSAFLESGGFNPDWFPTGDKIFHLRMAHNKNVYLTNLHAGTYRFIDNITLQGGMLTHYIEQNFHLTNYLSKELKKRWIPSYFRGYCYFSLHRKKYRRFGVNLDKDKINALFDKRLGFKDFIYFCFVWGIASIFWAFRVLIAATPFTRQKRAGS